MNISNLFDSNTLIRLAAGIIHENLPVSEKDGFLQNLDKALRSRSPDAKLDFVKFAEAFIEMLKTDQTPIEEDLVS